MYPFDTAYDPYRPWLSYGSYGLGGGQPIEGPAGGGGYQPSYFSTLLNTGALPAVDPKVLLQEAPSMSASRQGDPQALADLVKRQFEMQGSALQELYSPFGLEAATQDIRSLLTGGQSAYGTAAALQQFGTRDATAAQRQAWGAQLLGDVQSQVDLGGGRYFNPLSYDILSGEYPLGPSDLSGQGQLYMTAGMLSLHDLDITQGIQQTLQSSLAEGANRKTFSTYGERVLDPLAAFKIGEGQAIKQDASSLGYWLDQWYNSKKIYGSVGDRMGSMLAAGLTTL